MGHLGTIRVLITMLLPLTEFQLPTFVSQPRVWVLVAFDYLDPTFGTHRILGLKIALMMPPRRVNQCLHPDKGLPQTSDQNQPPFQQPSTQTLPTITEATEHPTFDNIPEIQLQEANISIAAVGTSQTGRSD
jgi:hypothetical protein